MKQVLIFFSNVRQLSTLLNCVGQFFVFDQNNPIKISLNRGNKLLYILNDNTNNIVLNNELKGIMSDNKNKVFVIKHSQTDDNIITWFNNNDHEHKAEVIILPDMHENTSGYKSKYYILLEKVHKKDNNYTLTESEFDEIWEKVSGSMLEATLNLLHGLLESKDTELPDELSEFNNDYEQFKNNVNDITDTTDESYIKALAEFRDALFSKILNV